MVMTFVLANMSKSIPDQFFIKLKNKELTEQDRLQLTNWLSTASDAEVEEVLDKYGWYFENETDVPYPVDSHLVKLIENKINEAEYPAGLRDNQPSSVVSWSYFKKAITVAASVCVICFSYYIIKQRSKSQLSHTIAKASKIVPGGNKAVLTLANGTMIVLDSAKNGMLANQGDVHIYKSKNGQLVYDVSKTSLDDSHKLAYNTITTQRGGQYQVILPDGSQVWLNAESSLKYPARFNGSSREVELNGEAYFEVAKDKRHPFKVSANNMQVEVLGTHFNIMDYKDESATKTTLLEGSVKILKGQVQQMIVPGQLAIVSENIKVITVNVEEAVEWKNGNFNFSHEKLESIMRKIARWYDVDVTYQPKTTTATFIGTIPRSQNITEVLKYLELTGLVHFKIEERRIITMP
ncbi:MAG: FecR family protein [Mucilaginibacter sp.]|nr:FecR family protein [Mucilaginibacter sp.]